jgi:hypothetical protein
LRSFVGSRVAALTGETVPVSGTEACDETPALRNWKLKRKKK